MSAHSLFRYFSNMQSTCLLSGFWCIEKINRRRIPIIIGHNVLHEHMLNIFNALIVGKAYSVNAKYSFIDSIQLMLLNLELQN